MNDVLIRKLYNIRAVRGIEFIRLDGGGYFMYTWLSLNYYFERTSKMVINDVK